MLSGSWAWGRALLMQCNLGSEYLSLTAAKGLLLSLASAALWCKSRSSSMQHPAQQGGFFWVLPGQGDETNIISIRILAWQDAHDSYLLPHTHFRAGYTGCSAQ